MRYARQPKRRKQKSKQARYERERARQIFISQEITYADYIVYRGKWPRADKQSRNKRIS